ncbi:MAG: B12-binding domain-containing radical SAM protein [Promethearchaeota archaeon]
MFSKFSVKKDLNRVDLIFGLTYPNIQEIGMSSHAIRLLYFMINSQENMACERVFLPDHIRYPHSRHKYYHEPVRTLEHQLLLKDLDILGFSIQFENDYRNVLWILENASCLSKKNAPFWEQKNRNERLPLIIGGGPVITSNPLPFTKFFDVFFIGDAEPSLLTFLNHYLEWNQEIITNREFLNKIKQLPGVYIPRLKNPVKRAILENLDDSPSPIPQSSFPKIERKGTFQHHYFIEVNRGCPFQCKFCLSSFHNYPFRNKSIEKIFEEIEACKKMGVFDVIAFIGSCVSAHPRFTDICKKVLNSGLSFTLPSIRIEHLTKENISLMEQVGIKTITIAPETGSEALRRSIGKNISDVMILNTIKRLRESQIRNIKFYFLIGLPNETEEDIENIISLVLQINALGFEKHALRINVNPFIPKFNTPFQFEITHLLKENIQYLLQSYQKLEKGLKKVKSIKINFKNAKNILNKARLQAFISLGDEKMGELLECYYQQGANFGALRRAEKLLGFSMDSYFLKIKKGHQPWKLYS